MPDSASFTCPFYLFIYCLLQAILDGTLLKDKRKVDAFVELHIEQWPRLEAEGAVMGVVQAIAAPLHCEPDSTETAAMQGPS